MAIDLFNYWSYNSLFHWTNNTSYSNEYLDTNSPAFTSSSARSTAILGNCYLVYMYLICGIETFGINMLFLKRK